MDYRKYLAGMTKAQLDGIALKALEKHLLEHRIEELENALKKLVDLKAIEDALVSMPKGFIIRKTEYEQRKAAAWEAAKQLIYPEKGE